MDSGVVLVILRLIALVFLVLANGFFVAAEFALVSVRRTRIAELVAKGNTRARWVQKAIDDPDRFIAATQLGITLASLGLGWIAEPALGTILEPLIRLFPAQIEDEVAHSLSAGLSFAIITFLHVVIGELAPKSIALQHPERTSLYVAQPTVWTERIFKPFIWALNGTGNALLRWVGVEPAAGHELVHSVEELKMLVRASAQSGVVGGEAEEMLTAVFDFGGLLVRQVMIPRTEMIAVREDAPIDEIIELAVGNPFTKFPVYAENQDQILGVVNIKDLLFAFNGARSDQQTARDLMREAIFIPETARVNTLLQLPDGSTLVDGLTLIEEVNEHFGLELDDPNYDTIAGYLLGHLERLAQVGDSVQIDGVRLRVEAMDGFRVARISITRLRQSNSDSNKPALNKT
jgi:CBS domain containing-hemolysin-like protein